MTVSIYLQERSALYQLLEVFHEFILEQYAEMWELIQYEGTKEVPDVHSIVKAVYQRLYQEISEALVQQVATEHPLFEFTKPVTTELYSELFDQSISASDLNYDERLFDQLCYEVEKYFTLYQIFHADRDGKLIHHPTVEVW